jgi:hypothetical protein
MDEALSSIAQNLCYSAPSPYSSSTADVHFVPVRSLMSGSVFAKRLELGVIRLGTRNDEKEGEGEDGALKCVSPRSKGLQPT